jgi:hypothetical protein
MVGAKKTAKKYLGDIGKTWDEYDTERRRVFKASWILGALTFIAGIAGDLLDWWSNLNFWPNAMSSISGFFVGVPTALVLLSTITREREDKLQRGKIEALSDRAWREFASRVYRYCSIEQSEARLALTGALAHVWEGLRKRSVEIVDPTPSEATRPSDDVLDELITAFRAVADEMDGFLRHIADMWPSGEMLTMQWFAIVRAWTLLDVYVKIQRFECGLVEWIAEGPDAQIQQKMLHEPAPVTDFSVLHDEFYLGGADILSPSVGVLDSPSIGVISPKAGMAAIPGHLKRLASEGRESVYDAIRDTNGVFHRLTEAVYLEAASKATLFLAELGSAVYAAENAEGWPATARVSSGFQIGDISTEVRSERLSNMIKFIAARAGVGEPRSQSDTPGATAS